VAEDLERVAFLHRDRCGVEQGRRELYKLFPILRRRIADAGHLACDQGPAAAPPFRRAVYESATTRDPASFTIIKTIIRERTTTAFLVGRNAKLALQAAAAALC
jgi:ABC-type branched-subunit amino acid transport system ATPase component